MRILVFSDDVYHPAAIVRQGLETLARTEGGEWTWNEDATGWNPNGLRDVDVVVLAKSDVCSAKNPVPWLRGEAAAALVSFVNGGGGLLALHSGTASYHDNPVIRPLLGGVFLRHPDPCTVRLEGVGASPLLHAVQLPAEIHDEHYVMQLDDKAADIFLRSRSEGLDEPAGWTRREGEGRICAFTPGHFLPVWKHAAVSRLIENGLRWVAKA